MRIVQEDTHVNIHVNVIKFEMNCIILQDQATDPSISMTIFPFDDRKEEKKTMNLNTISSLRYQHRERYQFRFVQTNVSKKKNLVFFANALLSQNEL